MKTLLVVLAAFLFALSASADEYQLAADKALAAKAAMFDAMGLEVHLCGSVQHG